MELTLLTVPDCPNASTFEDRLAAALADYPHLTITRRQIADEPTAADAGMHGSPTLLINGTDPFAMPGQEASLSCRIYRDDAGRTGRAPSVEALRRAIAGASDS